VTKKTLGELCFVSAFSASLQKPVSQTKTTIILYTDTQSSSYIIHKQTTQNRPRFSPPAMTDIGQKYELDKALSGSESPKEPVKVDMQAAHEAQEVRGLGKGKNGAENFETHVLSLPARKRPAPI
jgi:hypothetical protein